MLKTQIYVIKFLLNTDIHVSISTAKLTESETRKKTDEELIDKSDTVE